MIKLIKSILSKKKEHKPITEQVKSFVTDRPFDKIRLRDYYDNRFDNNEFYRLNVELGLIIFIDLTGNKEIENYLNENYDALKDSMRLKGRTFIKNIKEIEIPTEFDIDYFYPFLHKTVLPDLTKEDEIPLLDFLGYNGNIKTGFLSFTSNGISFLGLRENENIEGFVSFYISDLSVDFYGSNRILYNLKEKDNDCEPRIAIDSETESALKLIEDNLLKLKQSGQFFLIAPKLENMFKSIFEHGANLEVVQSELFIDKEFRIFLPQYQNIEISLSHLTKAIYILFLRHPEGILLSELYKYEDELLAIYKAISYQVSLDKMRNSVEELINNNKAIFVHFSRIKSAFVQKFTDSYAKFYYIQGEKGKEKSIRLPASKIIFEKEI